MNITQQNIDSLSATITLTIEKEDYAGKIEKILKDYRKNAQVPGFRKGLAPMGMIRKQYGNKVEMDEINKLVSEGLQKHLADADFTILGEPMPNPNQGVIDFDKDETFEFLFDIGISPKVEIDLSDKDSVVLYEITPEADAVDKRIAQLTSQFAEVTNPDTVEGSDMVRGDLIQVDADGNVVEDGLSKDAAVISPERSLVGDAKDMFLGAKVGTNVVFTPAEAMTPEEATALFSVEIDALAGLSFKMTVTEVVRYVDAQVNEDLFAKAFPSAEIKTEEEFKARLEEEVKQQLSAESNARFEWEARDFMIGKLKDVAFPETFLKSWITASNKNREDFSAEKLDAEFPKVLDDIRWQLATSTIVETAGLKMEAEDPLNAAKKMAAQQFSMYGMANLPEEYYEDYAKKMLEDQKQAEQIITRVMTEKVMLHIKDTVKLDTKEITMADFQKLYEATKNA